jgi:hypothetical protein
MATLRIKFEITLNEVIPTQYELKGSICCTKDVYYNIGSERLNMSYPNRPTMLANQPFTVWCARKVDFSGMIHDEEKVVEGKGKITNFKNNTISMRKDALQCVTWSDHMLSRIYYQQHFRAMTENSTRKKLPPYLLVNDVAELRENVFFYFIWSDNLTENTKYLSGGSKYLEITFALNYSKDDDDEDEKL